MLAHYEQVFPGCAERIVKMAENQAEHRQGLERHVIHSNASNERLGQIFAFILGLTAILGGVYLIANGQSGQGLTSIIAALGALAGVFVYGRHQQRREREQQRASLSPESP
jgi:uncharacterized membrane protein